MPPAGSKASPAPAKKSGGKLGFVTMCVLMGLAAPFMLPTVVLILIGLIPTYVALATDNDPQKSGAVSVGAMNFAGILPFILDLWKKGQTLPNAFHVLGEPNTWLIILGASAIGQLVVYAIPQAIATLTLTSAETRVKLLKKNLEALKEAWGPEVATTKPLDKIIQN